MNKYQKLKFKKWKKLINISLTELIEYKTSHLGELSSKIGKASADAIIKMMVKEPIIWDTNDWKWANKQISFVSRMSKAKGALVKNNKPTPKLMSLLIWGHKPKNISVRKIINL